VERDVAIARRVFPQIFLVAIVSGIEIRERQYLDCRRCLQRRLEPTHLGEDYGKVTVGRRIVDTRPVASATVFSLTVERCGIYGFEEKLQEEGQGDLIRVIGYGDSFGEAGLVGIYLFIGRVGNIAVGEAHLGGKDAGNEREEMLETPETSSGKTDVAYGAVVAAAEERYNVGDGRQVVLVDRVEGCEAVTVDVKNSPCVILVVEEWYHYLAAGSVAASNVAGELFHVVDTESFALLPCRAADALAERDTGTCYGPLKGAED
jgi:hypothetical protein